MTRYEVGEYIGCGTAAAFFRLRKYPRIGVKILSKEGDSFLSKGKCKRKLQWELAVGKLLRKSGISVPRYIGVVKVKFPEYFAQTMETRKSQIAIEKDAKNIEMGVQGLSAIIKSLTGKVRWGLLIELVENDVSIISKERLAYYHQREIDKVESLGITVRDSKLARNVLWSSSRRKLYLIDFEFWKLSSELEKQLKKGLWKTFF